MNIIRIDESIKFLRSIIKTGRIIFIDEKEKLSAQEYINKFDEAIKQFKVCAKYKEIWEEFKMIFGSDDIRKAHGTTNIKELMEDIEQKYFQNDNPDEEVSKIIDKMAEMINQGRVTFKQFAEALTPKD